MLGPRNFPQRSSQESGMRFRFQPNTNSIHYSLFKLLADRPSQRLELLCGFNNCSLKHQLDN
jgi:hypothetical protein